MIIEQDRVGQNKNKNKKRKMEEIYDLQREYNERRNGMEEIIVKKA